MKLYVIRHGETEENASGILMGHHPGHLTSNGLLHAKENALSLKNTKLDVIYTSDLKRCVDTAFEIQRLHPSTQLFKTKELREVNLGILQGKRRDDVDWDKELGKDHYKGKPQDGESIFELRQRVERFIESLINKHHSESVLLVTHAGVIRQILSIAIGIPSKEVYETIQIHHDKVFEFEFGERWAYKIP